MSWRECVHVLKGLLDNLPHRPPFRFVTSIEELEIGRRCAGVWRVRGDEEFFMGHFPGNPMVPGVLLAEALAQVSGLVPSGGIGGGSPAESDDPCISGAVRLAQVSVKFQAGVVPPAEVWLESVLTRTMAGLYLFDVRAEVGGVAVASGTLVLAEVPVGDRVQGGAAL